MHQVHDSIEIFVKNLENYRHISVPESWKSNHLVIQANEAIRNGQESIQARMERWNKARAVLLEMGFQEYTFIQKMLILQYDGDVDRIVDDLLVRKGQAENINSTFVRLSQSIFQLFHTFGEFLRVNGTEAVQSVGNQVNEGILYSAQFVNAQSRDVTLNALQENVNAYQEQFKTIAEVGTQASIAGYNEAIALSNKHIQNLRTQASQAGYQYSLTTMNLLADSIRHLGAIFLQASRQIPTSQPEVFKCSVCQNPIEGTRYLCAACNSVVLCERCEAIPNSHNPDHILMKIRIQQQPQKQEMCDS